MMLPHSESWIVIRESWIVKEFGLDDPRITIRD